MYPGVRVLKASLLVALLYIAAYFMLMARNVPAVDVQGNIAFSSSFRFSRPAGRLGPLTMTASESSIFNYLFYPADKVFYALAPRNYSVNSVP